MQSRVFKSVCFWALLNRKEYRRVFLPKIGWVGYRKSRLIKGTPKNITLSRKGKYWYLSIQTEYEKEIPLHPSNSIVGIDMGIKRFATLSNGEVFKPLNSFGKLKAKLKRHQRRLAKKIKFSANWKKQKRKISSLHEHIARARRDYLHKISTKISKSHAMEVLAKIAFAAKFDDFDSKGYCSKLTYPAKDRRFRTIALRG